ncbi:MAG: ribonuclease HII [Bacteroidales bacterium]|nr:ribonuclease HII [Bacteroidales bacterium]
MLLNCYKKNANECGCDEAGRGCLAGAVYAAAVILPKGYANERLNDSKQLSAKQREQLRSEIERDADAWAVAAVSPAEVDRLNILHASTHAMCLAVKALIIGSSADGIQCGGYKLGKVKPEMLLIDGNRFYNETGLPYQCFVKGDGRFMSIAAASILAKTHRDEYMASLHTLHPQYGWDSNKGYPTAKHYEAIERFGITPFHRKSFKLERQLEMSF